MNVESEIEQKSIINEVINNLVAVINVEHFREQIRAFLLKHYGQGMETAELQFNMNFIPDDRTLEFLDSYVRNTMKFHTDSLGNALRGEISRALMNGEKVSQLKKHIRDTLEDQQFTDRLKTVMRTEGLRAGNMGQLDGALQSGLKLKKYISIIRDDRTSDICLEEDRKYGKPSQAIDLDKEFIVKVDNKIVRIQAPPAHPNCRSVIQFVEAEP